MVDLASLAIWLLAIYTVYTGAVRAAEDDREANYYVDDKSSKGGATPTSAADEIEYGSLPEAGAGKSSSNSSSSGLMFNDDDEDDEESKSPFGGLFAGPNDSFQNNNHSPSARSTKSKSSQSSARAGPIDNPDNIDITFTQAILFVVVSSIFLLLLYFVDLYFVVSIVYLCAAAIATAFITLEPMYRALLGPSDSKDNCCSFFESARRRRADDALIFDCALIAAVATGAGLSVTWYLFKNELDYIWVVQDLLGINVCILFLSSIRLPNLKVASTLLILAFCYDVFFVFISPYIFSSSVMLSVAEGSSSSSDASTNEAYLSDENYCEKYPDEDVCSTSTLPMLLTVPTFSSYTSTESILGLGDIVLPGESRRAVWSKTGCPYYVYMFTLVAAQVCCWCGPLAWTFVSTATSRTWIVSTVISIPRWSPMLRGFCWRITQCRTSRLGRLVKLFVSLLCTGC
jgi:uncharacterized membrane protein